MAIQKWVAGAGAAGLSWTSLFTSVTTLFDLNTMPNGSAAASSTGAVSNSALDVFADISVSLASITPSSSYLGGLSIFILPLNGDGTTYGDGQFANTGAQTTKVPQAAYWVGNITFPTGVAAVQQGTLRGVLLPPTNFQVVIQNNTGVSLASSGNVVKYWTYDLQVS